MILAHFIGKKNWKNSRTRSGRIIKPHYKEVTRRGRQLFARRIDQPVGSPGSTRAPGVLAQGLPQGRRHRWPAAVAGEARPLKRMRRDRDRGARTPIIRADSWIGGSALPSCKSRAGNDRRDKRGSTG